MKTTMNIRAFLPHILLILLSAGLAAILLVSPLLSAPQVRAAANATCTTTADGDWGDAIWDCGTPTSADDVVINHEVTISSDQTVQSLTIDAYAILQFTAPVTLTVNGNFTVDSLGLFDPGNDMDTTGGTVVLGDGSQVVTTNGNWVDFYNLTKASSAGSETLSVDPQSGDNGGIHVLNELTLTGTASDNLSLRSTTTGQPWGVWPEFTPQVDYVDVQDSNNFGPESISVANGVDSGNNTAWLFNGTVGIVVTSSQNPSSAGHDVIFTATLTPADAAGTVAFLDGGDALDGCDAKVVSAGVATCTTEELTAGAHTITAVFTGSDSFAGVTGTSDDFTQTVGSLSVVSLSASPHPSAFGADITLKAVVSPNSISNGSVAFKNGASVIAGCENVAIQTVNGHPTATCTVSSLELGSHTFIASYSGYDIFAASTSTPLVQVVKYASTVTLVPSANPIVVGYAIHLTANVTPGTSTGSVTFKRGGMVIPGCGNVALNNGSAQCTPNRLVVGDYSITAEYSGDSQTFAGVSTPLALSVTVQTIYFPVIGR